MLTDLEIAHSVTPKHIAEIGKKVGLQEDDLEFYGKYKAKLPLHLADADKNKHGNLILVTAVTPTPSGEGKTTASIGLTDGLNRIGKKAVAALREPSLGPVFGIKGGAAGGGYSQVIPMEDINLHFTGDFNAVEKANNLLAALIDNDIQKKSDSLGIDPRTVTWKRVMDMNDRALRSIISGLGGKPGGMPREAGFNITAASEVMAILCLAEDFADLKKRLGNIYIGDTYTGEPVFAKDLKAEGAMAILLKDAIRPNLVQTLEGNPVIIHGGPFANIAQGTNSVIATRTGLNLADYTVTEAGFGADLGAEKFFNIKCASSGLSPKAVVIVATVRALKYHGGAALSDLQTENTSALRKGLANLEKHVETVQSFGVPPVLAINKFASDTDAEIQVLLDFCKNKGIRGAISTGFAEGGKGCEQLAKEVVAAVDSCEHDFSPTYSAEDSLLEKMQKITRKVYGGTNVELSKKAVAQLKRFEQLGLHQLPVCMAKTQKSLSDNESLIGRPEGFTISIREFEIAAGAGFIIPIAGNMLRMPGLPGTPAAVNMNIDEHGTITGLS